MNNQQKTPEQWFQLLKEPYRTEAIANIDKSVRNFKDFPESLSEALLYCIHWGETPTKPPTREDWEEIYYSVIKGETTYLAEPELKPQEEKKEVESKLEKGEIYFYLGEEHYKATGSLNYAIQYAEPLTTIYKATPVGIKLNKPILEPINK